ncbi:hypothetical protein Tco_0527921 [Tanacetum coccineum]
MATSYHPQLEVVNRSLECYLRFMTGEQPKQMCISMLQLELLHLREREAVVELLKFHMKRAQDRMKSKADKYRTDKEFDCGDWDLTCVASRLRSSWFLGFSSSPLDMRKIFPYFLDQPWDSIDAYELSLKGDASPPDARGSNKEKGRMWLAWWPRLGLEELGASFTQGMVSSIPIVGSISQLREILPSLPCKLSVILQLTCMCPSDPIIALSILMSWAYAFPQTRLIIRSHELRPTVLRSPLIVQRLTEFRETLVVSCYVLQGVLRGPLFLLGFTQLLAIVQCFTAFK